MPDVCIWIERNDWSFEDRERSLDDHSSFSFRTLFFWASVIVLNGSTMHDSLVFISSAELVIGVLFLTPCVLVSIKFYFTSKKLIFFILGDPS